MNNLSTQVLVVGGGPAGSTTAGLLARQGLDVIVVDRARFPREHIGESLLPSCLYVFDLLGVRATIEQYGFQVKEGGFFDWGGREWFLPFKELSGRGGAYSFQVVRSEFDRLMLRHARSQGATVMEEVRITDVAFDGEGRPHRATFSDGHGSPGTIDFQYLVDASGRAGLLATRYLANRTFHEAFRNVAVWGYWKNAGPLGAAPAGATASCSIPNGWLWAIPLHNGTLSVGLVLHKSSFQETYRRATLEQIYHEGIAASASMSARLAGAELVSPIKTETDYSYAADSFAGPGYVLAGDAACFLDPLLSTGIHLATFSGLLAAASIVSIARGDIDEQEAMRFYDASYRQAYLRLLVLLSAFYQQDLGEESYFTQAQQLTRHDYDSAALQAAFLHIVSGIEDLKDIDGTDAESIVTGVTAALKDRHRAMGHAPMDGGQQRDGGAARLASSIRGEVSLSPASAVGGLYVVAEPLGLGRVPTPAAVPAAVS